jgi:hypothetical protein
MASGQELMHLLSSNGVAADIIKHLTDKGCNSVAAFHNWVDDATMIKGEILAKTSEKDSVAQLAYLKQAWRAAEAKNTKALKRAGEGLSIEAMDDPLPDSSQRNIEAVFLKFYNWPSLDVEVMGCDSVLARIRREFEARQPSLIPFQKVRSVSEAVATTGAKRARLSDFAVVQFEGMDDYEESPSRYLRVFIASVEKVVLTWAVAGCFDVTWKGEQKKYVHWSEVTSYLKTIKKHTNDKIGKYSEGSIVNWVIEVEHKFRAAAIQLARTGDLEARMPWGLSLLEAIKNGSHEWQEADHLLIAYRSPQTKGDGKYTKGKEDNRTGNKGGRNDKGGNRQTDDRSREPYAPARTTGEVHGQKQICRAFNDKRGCRKPCPNGRDHVCDVILQKDNKVCGSRNHGRSSHNASHHGAHATRR